MPPRPTEADERLDYPGAADLARQVRDFWFNKGYPHVRVWTEPIILQTSGMAMPRTLYQVRSNLHNALPPLMPT